MGSHCADFHELIEDALRRGRNAMGIYQGLVDAHGYGHSYESVKRYVRALRRARTPEAHPIITTAAGQEGQVDYGGDGPMVRDPTTGQVPPREALHVGARLQPQSGPPLVRAKVTVIRGALCDAAAAAVAAAVRSSRPEAIVDASSALPFGHDKGQPANNADRSIFTKATVETLEADGRLADCVMVIIGGQLLPEPGGSIDKWSVAAMAWMIRNVAARRAWREAEAWVRWCFEGAPPSFRFVYARLGQMVEQLARGTLRAEPTEENIQRGSASYCDVAEALVQLAGDPERTWERKALFFNYTGALG